MVDRDLAHGHPASGGLFGRVDIKDHGEAVVPMQEGTLDPCLMGLERVVPPGMLAPYAVQPRGLAPRTAVIGCFTETAFGA